MNEFELKPCPFCGGFPKLEDHRLLWSVKCQVCSACVLGERAPEPRGDGVSDDATQDATDWAYFEQSAVKAWNTRTPATSCPGHGRSECVSCCWPKGDAPLSGVELGRQLVEQVLSVTPENYAGHSFGVSAPDGSTLGDVIITVVKPDGKGPHELRVEAESRLAESDRLRDAMEVAINTLVYCYDKRPENFAAALTEAQRLAAESRDAKL